MTATMTRARDGGGRRPLESITVTVHAGMPKSGSTFLQKEVFRKIDSAFSNHALARPQHRVLMRAFAEGWQRSATEVDPDLSACRRAIREAVEASGFDRALMSVAPICGEPSCGFIDRDTRAAFLKSVFPEAKIFLIFRRQDTFIESFYKHAVGKGYARTVADQFNLHHRFDRSAYDPSARSYSAHADYREIDIADMVARYHHLFGPQNVLCVPYEWFNRNQTETVRRLADFSGIALPESFRLTREHNRGLSQRAIGAIRLLNRFTPFKAAEYPRPPQSSSQFPRGGRCRGELRLADLHVNS